MAETRKFAQGLKHKGILSNRRESSLQQARNSQYSEFNFDRPSSSDPIDYESYILELESEIKRDPLRDILVFPHDDIITRKVSREYRTVVSTVPDSSLKEASSLMVKECIQNYSSDWYEVEKKYAEYGRDYLSLPKLEDNSANNLPLQVFDLNDEHTLDGNVSIFPKQDVTKQGWLYKAPDISMNNVSMKAFKRRFCHLQQLPDRSYILNYFKDDKISKDPKGAIYLDSCIGAFLTNKGRKHAFEIRMQEQNFHLFAAESEHDATEWISTINQAVQNASEEHLSQKDEQGSNKQHKAGEGDLENLKNSMHPELLKYAKEMEQKNTAERKKNRLKIFKICPDFQDKFLKTAEKSSKKLRVPIPPTLGKSKLRVMVNCKSINFALRGVVVDGVEEPITNVEPFFLSLSLYDLSTGKKISADLHVDINHPLVRRMIPVHAHGNQLLKTTHSVDHAKMAVPPVDNEWVAYPKKGIFNISNPSRDVYLVVSIEKVLQGSIKSCALPYMRSDVDNHKAALKVLKHAKVACQRLGQYRMPFAWTAKQLFANDKGHLNTREFDYVYKQESSKLSQEDLLKFLSDFKRQEKLSKLECIDCDLQIDIDFVPTDLTNILTTSLVPVKPYNATASEPIFEVDELIMKSSSTEHMNMEYTNHCYVYPKSLNYDNQKVFAKARNITVVAEFRDTDDESASPLPVFYQRPPGSGVFCSRVSTPVLHHQERPEFYEEWKVALPTQLHHGHHFVFTFYHVVVDINSKKKDTNHIEVGQAFLPLLMKDGRVLTGEQTLPVATSLPSGYLNSHDHVTKSHELKWVDGGKHLFRVGVSLVSSLYTDDQHLHNFFEACNRFQSGKSSDIDIIKYIKSLLSCELGPLLRFFPTIMKQLLFLFTADSFGPEAGSLAVKTLVNIVATCHANNCNILLQQYIKYMFTTAPWKDYKSKTIHEELATAMISFLRQTNDFLTANQLLLHLSFFLQIIVKSMIQHLNSMDKFKLRRSERFPMSFQFAIQSLITSAVPHIVKKWKTNYAEVHAANLSLATFMCDCFAFMDRGFVFKLINLYFTNFSSDDVKVLYEMKFEFLREVCNYEHYIPLNLPFIHTDKTGKKRYSYCLSDDYCHHHFLTGLLLKNLCTALFKPSEIRVIAIEMFRNLLAKHAFDNRYKSSDCHSRIACLYLPFLHMVLENVSRFSNDADSLNNIFEPETDASDTQPSKSAGSVFSPIHLPSVSERTGSLRMRVADSSLMSTIANPGSTLLSRGFSTSGDCLSTPGTPTATGKLSEKSATEKSTDSLKEVASIASENLFVDGSKFDEAELRSILLCFLYIVENLPSDALLGFWKNSTTSEQVDFFQVLIMCLQHFRYSGKKQHSQGKKLGSLSKTLGGISRSFPARLRSSGAHLYKHVSILAEPIVAQADDEELQRESLLEANLSTEVGKVVLDVLSEFMVQYKKQLQSQDGDNPLMVKFFDVLLSFFQIGQSEEVQHHVFAMLRLIVHKFSSVLFRGSADLCASLIFRVLKCCNSGMASTRAEACALLYLVMRKNYKSSQARNFVRSHLQMIKAVSQLISKEIGIGSTRFHHSLSVINTHAINDKEMQSTPFPVEVKELTRKIRNVLLATSAMKEHRHDPEMLIDLQCSLAKSYSATPELRKTWLESMARTHMSNKNFSEAAMCYVHIAALVAEYLKRKGDLSSGCSSFRIISQNVEKEESSIKEDAGMQDVHYNEDFLVQLLHTCADTLRMAERYELLYPTYNMVIPYYERRRQYDALISIHSRLKEGYEKVVEVNRNGKRLLGTYFRIALYGQSCFKEEDGKQYIYKEPKLTQLSEISQRLIFMYGKKFGEDKVQLIQDSGKIDKKKLNPALAYIQVTYVLPYFDAHEREQRHGYFEQHHNVRNFIFETPFTLDGRARGSIEGQWKRKTILTTTHCFPYITKRIPVTSTRSLELKPIEVALDEMTSKCNELEQLIMSDRVDLKKLQLRLQGSVNVQVNAGPLAYAQAFLRDDKLANHAANTVEMLRQMYRRFVNLCAKALSINEQMISSNQYAYHQSLKQCFVAMTEELSQILHEQLFQEDDDAISIALSTAESEHFPKRSVAGSVSDASLA